MEFFNLLNSSSAFGPLARSTGVLEAASSVPSAGAQATWVDLVRIALAILAAVAITWDVDHRVFGPAPNWPLIAIEPVALVGYLRCTLRPLLIR